MCVKKARNNFSRNTRIVREKILGKKSSEKSAKNVFYIQTNTVPKKGVGKSAKQFFQKHTNNARKKCWGNIVGKKWEKRFLYSHEYRELKMGGKNARNNFSRNTRIVRAKNVGEKNCRKKMRITFFIFTRISWPKIGGKKTRETIFPETHE